MPFSVNGEVDIQTSLTIQSQLSNGTWVDSMKFTDNVISTQVTDGDIQIAPNGSGNVYLGLLNNNEQITVGSTLNLYDNVITTTTTNGIISIIPDGNGHIKLNTLNILNDGTLENTVNNGNINIYPNGTGILRLTENIEIVKNGTSSYTELSSDLQSNVSITSANIGVGFSGRNIVVNPSGNGYFISGDIGIKENVLKGLTTSKNITIQSPYNEMEFQNNNITLRSLNSSVGPSLKFEYSLNSVSVDTLMSINSVHGGLEITSPSFGLSFDGINSVISLDSSNNLVYNGSVSLTAPSGDALVVTSGNTRLNGGTLYVAGILTANNGITTNTIDINGDATISNGDLNVNGNIYKNGVSVVNSQWSYALNLTDIYFNNNVGINNISPAYNVDIVGDINYTGTLYNNGVPFVGSLWSQSTNDLYYVGGNIGIGLVNPGSTLDVAGDINFSGDIYQNNNLFLSTQWINGTTNKIYYDSGNVGIGLINPIYLLDVDGDINCSGSLRVNGIQVTNPWDIDNSNNLSYTAGKIGIGINSPDSNLHVYTTQNTTSVIYPISIQSNTTDVNVSNNSGGVGIKFIASRGTGTDHHTGSIYSQLYDGSGTTNDKWSYKFNLKHGSTMNDVMVMRSDGNIGIGISNPVTKLHVNNTDNTSTNLVTLENVSNSSLIGTAKMIVMNNLRNYNTDTQEQNTPTCGTDIITVNGDNDVRYSGFTLTELSKLRVEYDYPANSSNYTSSSFCIYTNGGTGNTEKLRVTGSGNVGIGTTSPDLDLVISKSNSSYIKLVNTNSNNTIVLGAISSGTRLYSRQTDDLTPVEFSIDQGSLGNTFVLDTSGNVGIGVSSPAAKLDISGSYTNGRGIQIRSGDDNNHTDSAQVIFSYNNASYDNSGYAHSIKTRHNANASSGNAIDFWLWNHGVDTTNTLGTLQVMTLDGTGNVGIGTSSPGEILDVRGNLRVGTSGNSNYIAFYGTTDDGAGQWNHTYIGEREYDTGKSELFIYKGNEYGTTAYPEGPDRIRYTSTGGHLFQTTGTVVGDFETTASHTQFLKNRMLINPIGKIGMGDIADPEANLHIHVPYTSGVSTKMLYVDGKSGLSVPQVEFNKGLNGLLINTYDATSSNLVNTYALHLQNSSDTITTDILYVRNDGNVGIGNNSPQSKLHVTASNGKRGILVDGDSGSSDVQAYFDGSTYGVFIKTNNTSSSYYSLAINNSANNILLYVRNDGNVGIGTDSPAEKLDVAGTLRHQGLTLNEGTTPNVDEIKTFGLFLTVTTSWSDTGISGNDLSSGTYIMHVFTYSTTTPNGGGTTSGNLEQYDMTYSATIAWWSGSCTDNRYTEIVLHSSGRSTGSGNVIYLRTFRDSVSNSLKLQIRSSIINGVTPDGTIPNFTFKFRRMI